MFPYTTSPWASTLGNGWLFVKVHAPTPLTTKGLEPPIARGPTCALKVIVWPVFKVAGNAGVLLELRVHRRVDHNRVYARGENERACRAAVGCDHLEGVCPHCRRVCHEDQCSCALARKRACQARRTHVDEVDRERRAPLGLVSIVL